jgi:MFS family permease
MVRRVFAEPISWGSSIFIYSVGRLQGAWVVCQLHQERGKRLSVFSQLDTATRRNLLVLFTAGLLFWAGLASLLPTLPAYIEAIGGTRHQVGIVMGSFAIGLLVSRPWLSQLADQRGRKIVLLIGMAAIAFAPVGYLLTANIPLLMVIRAFHGLSIAAFALAYSALVIDLSPAGQRGELIGYMSLVNPLGLAIGPALGGYLQEWLSYDAVFIMSFGMGIVGLLCTMRVVEPNAEDCVTDMVGDRTSAVPPKSTKFWGLLLSDRIRVPALIMLMVGLAFGTLSTFAPLYVKEVGIEINVGLFYTAAAIASFAVRLVAGPGSDRYGRGIFISLSVALYTTSMLLLWRTQSDVMFLVAGIFQGAGSGTLIPMIAALMADRSYANERGRTFGVCMTGFDLGIALAGPLLGAIADTTGITALFGLCGSMTFIGLLIFLTFSSKDVPHSLRFATGRGRDLYAVE